MHSPAAYCAAPGLDLVEVVGLCVHQLAPPVDIPVIWAICEGPPTWRTLQNIHARIAKHTVGQLRPGMDHWRQWAEQLLRAGTGNGEPPIGAFVTVTDQAGWRARLGSGDHALELAALREGAVYGVAADISGHRVPTLKDLVDSPTEGVLTFQQILAEALCNFGCAREDGPAAASFTRIARTLVNQTMRNALLLEPVAEDPAQMPRDVRETFVARYPEWACLLPERGDALPILYAATMEFFERIARDGANP